MGNKEFRRQVIRPVEGRDKNTGSLNQVYNFDLSNQANEKGETIDHYNIDEYTTKSAIYSILNTLVERNKDRAQSSQQ